MIVVDSSGWIEYFINGPLSDQFAVCIEGSEEILTPTIVLYEVFKKILRDADERAAVEAVAHMQTTTVVPLDAKLAVSSAEISLNHKLPMADAIVYTTALSSGAILITSDEHFQGLPGVNYIPKQK